MFVGELLCLLVFYFMRFVYNRPPKDQLSNFPRYVFALPAAFDVCSSSLMNLGLTMVPARAAATAAAAAAGADADAHFLPHLLDCRRTHRSSRCCGVRW